jgi:hypothetical protein
MSILAAITTFLITELLLAAMLITVVVLTVCWVVTFIIDKNLKKNMPVRIGENLIMWRGDLYSIHFADPKLIKSLLKAAEQSTK